MAMTDIIAPLTPDTWYQRSHSFERLALNYDILPDGHFALLISYLYPGRTC
jgi:hypothetical protein